jgi:hypothetical protein
MAVANLAGAASGPSALDYSQCQNGPTGTTLTPHDCVWVNGILNASGSHYLEDQTTPQRLLVSFPDNGGSATDTHVHSVTLKYLARKGTIHAYDSLGAANTVMADALDLRCDGIANCPSDIGDATNPSHTPVVPDPTPVPPESNSALTSATSDHQLAGDLHVYGAKFTTGPQTNFTSDNPPAMSTPVHDNASGTGDDYATTTISFITVGPGPHSVQLLFGGHLAVGAQPNGNDAPRGWGANLGAASVSGGPYHIKWAAADGVSVGNRDNQIMSNAIDNIAQQGVTLTTTPSPATKIVGDSALAAVKDTAVLSNITSGQNGTGTMEFDLYGPFTFASPPGLDSCDDTAGTGNRITHETGVAVSATANTWVSSTVDLSSYGPGIYQWVAHYSGDVYNSANDGSCGDSTEQLIVVGGSSTQTITDTVTVAGVGPPTGTVNWYLYTTSNCTDDGVAPPELVFSDVVGVGSDTNNALDSTGKAISEPFTPTPAAAGTTYYWKVTYSGDTNNAGGTIEACGAQQVTVNN